MRSRVYENKAGNNRSKARLYVLAKTTGAKIFESRVARNIGEVPGNNDSTHSLTPRDTQEESQTTTDDDTFNH